MPPSTPHILEAGAYVVLSILPTVCWHIISRRAKNSPSCVTLSKDWHRLWLHCTKWKWVSDPWNRTTLKILEAVASWTICWVAYYDLCSALIYLFVFIWWILLSLFSLCKCTVYFNFYAFTVCFLWFAVHGLILCIMDIYVGVYMCLMYCLNFFSQGHSWTLHLWQINWPVWGSDSKSSWAKIAFAAKIIVWNIFMQKTASSIPKCCSSDQRNADGHGLGCMLTWHGAEGLDLREIFVHEELTAC